MRQFAAVKRSVVFIGAMVLVTAVLVATVLGFILQQGIESDTDDLLRKVAKLERENAEQVNRHRDANQHDHDCIVALALILGDPNRDRELPPSLPPSCERAPAASEATES